MIEDPAATGVTALLFAVVLGLFEFLKRIWPASTRLTLTITVPLRLERLKVIL